MLRPFEVELFFNAVPFATRSFDSSPPFEVALFFNLLRPFEVALFFNAVPFKDADTAARSFERPFKDAGSICSFLRPLDADASRSFHTLGAAVPSFGAGDPLFKVGRPFKDAVRSFEPPSDTSTLPFAAGEPLAVASHGWGRGPFFYTIGKTCMYTSLPSLFVNN